MTFIRAFLFNNPMMFLVLTGENSNSDWNAS
jgi:hypothetical protein